MTEDGRQQGVARGVAPAPRRVGSCRRQWGKAPMEGSMRYEQRMRKYWQKKLEDPLPKLPEDERIYLNVPYMARDFAKYSHCGFDPERKLWFTGSLNRNLYDLVELYGVNEATSEKAKALMKAKLDEVAEVIRKIKEG